MNNKHSTLDPLIKWFFFSVVSAHLIIIVKMILTIGTLDTTSTKYYTYPSTNASDQSFNKPFNHPISEQSSLDIENDVTLNSQLENSDNISQKNPNQSFLSMEQSLISPNVGELQLISSRSGYRRIASGKEKNRIYQAFVKSGENGEFFIIAFGIAAGSIVFLFEEKRVWVPNWLIITGFSCTLFCAFICLACYMVIYNDPYYWGDTMDNSSILILILTILFSGICTTLINPGAQKMIDERLVK